MKIPSLFFNQDEKKQIIKQIRHYNFKFKYDGGPFIFPPTSSGKPKHYPYYQVTDIATI